MKKLIILFVMCFMLVGCQDNVMSEDENLKIVVASDLHYFLKDYYKDCEWFEESMLQGDGKMVTYGDEIVSAFIEKMKEIKPHLVVLTGDLTFNGEIGSHEALAKQLSLLRKEGIEVAVIPGNHDVDNIYTKGYGKDEYLEVENINAQKFKEIYQDLGYQNKKHKESLSYRIDLNDHYTLLMMDSCAHQLTGANLDIGGYFTESTLKWLTKQLQDIKQQHKIPIVAMHHSLISHNEVLGETYTIRDNQKIADILKDYSVPFVLTGHIHHQNIKEINGIYDIATSSLLDAPLQYGVIELNNQTMKYHNESLQISRDANEYFDLVSSTHFAETFEVIHDKEIREQMKDVVVKANRYYFTGNIYQYRDEIMNMEGYKYYYKKDLPKGLEFYKIYLESMLNDQNDHQNLTIKINE